MEKGSIQAAMQFDETRFTKINIIKTKVSVAFMLNFLPGQDMKPHNHPNRELYLHIVDGIGTLLIDEKDMEVTEGDVILCGAEEQVGFRNHSDSKVSIYATMTKIKE